MGLQSVTWLESGGFRELQPHINFPYAQNFTLDVSDAGRTIQRSNLLFTEINHGFINPTAEPYAEPIGRIVKDMAFWQDAAKAPGYDSPVSVFNEMMNWGLVDLYYTDFAPAADRETLIGANRRNMAERRGFRHFPAFSEFLVPLYRDRPAGTTIADLYPQIIDWFAQHQAKASAAETARPVTGSLLPVRGKNLYVEDIGPRDAPILLYVHGGPGTGSYDFSLHQGARLSKTLRLISFDQRGVLRSDALTAAEPFGLDDLVEDIEALRKQLKIVKWSVLGHSFGGQLASLYAARYPASVEILILENPSLDWGSSTRSQLRAIAREYEIIGKPDLATEAHAAADSNIAMPELWPIFLRLMRGLGSRWGALSVHGPEKDFFNRLVASAPIPQPNWARAGAHQQRLFEEGRIFESVLPRLRDLPMPVLLIKGAHDLAMAPEQLAAFKRDVRNGTVARFEQSGHFARFEEPERYSQLVSGFVLDNRRRD